MRLSLSQALSLATVLGSALALPVSDGDLDTKKIKATTHFRGQIIDWIKPESQGDLAKPPPASLAKRDQGHAKQPEVADYPRGPEGTVPILRSSGQELPSKRLPSLSDNGTSKVAARQDSAAGQHWYASSAQNVDNHGGQAVFSLFDPYVESGADFSLLQTCVSRDSAPTSGGGTTGQTVEAGWINYPNQIDPPHLFSYYTTNGYSADGDQIGGWNTDVTGWMQVDEELFPGVTFAPLSTDGGDQYELTIGYLLYEGNWWLFCKDRYIGYYPGSLFSSGVDPAATLGGGSDKIFFYGEIYNSEDTVTTTDMGSGEFPDTGFGHSAYIHNIVYHNTGDADVNYDGSGEVVVSDDARYRINTAFNSADSWASYFYLGGPGAGGVVGG